MNACVKANKLPPPGWSEPEQKVEGVFSPTSKIVTATGMQYPELCVDSRIGIDFCEKT